ncbi:MAG: exo-beta-N-acetylmuramidase NamZ domain-containing protein [Candidatus Bathyarchaeia archaeon]
MGVKKIRVKAGVEVLTRRSFEIIKGKRVGLVTNQTGVTESLRHVADVLYESPEIKLTALFGPEHGIRGDLQGGHVVESYADGRTGVPVYSLYGETKKPTMDMLSNVDVLLFDIQDVGARYYTYICTMSYAMEAASDSGIPFIVLDRPNPINGVSVEGNILNPEFKSFVGRYPIPVRHGMTVGELAMLFNAEYRIEADLKVVRMEGWLRDMWFDETGLVWVQPSPNIPTLETAIVYPGTCLLEGTNVSEGRGTTKPFELLGAPWIDSSKLTAELRSRRLPGALFRQAHFTPAFSKYRGERCSGVQVHVTERDTFRPFETALHIVDAVRRLNLDRFEWAKPESGSRYYFDTLAGTDKIRKRLCDGSSVSEMIDGFQEELSAFMEMSKNYILYNRQAPT